MFWFGVSGVFVVMTGISLVIKDGCLLRTMDPVKEIVSVAVLIQNEVES